MSSPANPSPRRPQDVSLATIRRAKLGDERAWEDIVRRYGGWILASIRKRTTGIESLDYEELAQDSFERAVSRLEQFRGPQSFGSWLMAIAQNRVSTEIRKTLERREVTRLLNNSRAVTTADPGDPSEIVAAIRALTPALREMAELVLLSDLTVADAAEALGISVEAAQARKGRALRSLREKLNSEDVRQKGRRG